MLPMTLSQLSTFCQNPSSSSQLQTRFVPLYYLNGLFADTTSAGSSLASMPYTNTAVYAGTWGDASLDNIEVCLPRGRLLLYLLLLASTCAHPHAAPPIRTGFSSQWTTRTRCRQ